MSTACVRIQNKDTAHVSLQQSVRYREIDYLRAYAIILVFLVHNFRQYKSFVPFIDNFFSLFEPGVGVDLFFAISGFVIAKALAAFWATDNAAGTSYLLGRALVFYRKRFVRLWPAMTVWLLLSFVGSLIFLGMEGWPNPLEMFRKVMSALVYLYNFHEYKVGSAFGYFWSLSVEWQFYLFFPLLLIWVKSDTRRTAVILVALALSLIFAPGGDGWWMFRFDGIVYGILAYIIFYRCNVTLPDYWLFKQSWGGAVFTGLLLLAIISSPLALSPYRLGFSIAGLLSTLLVVMAAANKNAISVFGLRAFISWTGSRSYSIYLSHIPCILSANCILEIITGQKRLESQTALTLVILNCATIAFVGVASELTYQFVERPSHLASRNIS